MATDTLTTLSNYFKTVYEPEWVKAFNEDFLGFELATKKRREFRGGSEVLGLQIQRTGGVGFRGETQALPMPTGPVPLQASVSLSRLFHVFEVSHDAVERSNGSDAAFKEILGEEIENGFMRMKKLSNIAFYGDGRGVLATVVTGGSLTASAGDTLQITVDTTRYLEPGDLVVLWTTASGATIVTNGGQSTTAAGYTANVDETTRVKTIDSSVLVTLERTKAAAGTCTVATSNAIRLYGDSITTGAARTDNAPTGLQLFADTTSISTTFQGINRSTYSRYQGQVIDAASTDLTRDLMYRLSDKIYRATGERPDTAIWDLTLRREYLAVVQPDVRFAPVKDLDAGYSQESLALSVGGKRLDLIEDTDVPFGTMFMFPRAFLHWFELSAMQLDASTGSVLKQALPYGAASGVGDVFYGYARSKGNFASEKPFAFGKITSINYTAE